MNYFQKHLGDIAKKTAHLTMLEYGAYNLILDAYYDREIGPTTIEATRWARARTEEEKSAVLAVLDEFFALGEDGRHTQTRVEEEIAKASIQIEDAEGKRDNERERQRRHRERRKELFARLRDFDDVPPWDTKNEQLQERLNTHLSRVTIAVQTADATATLYPIPNTHNPIEENLVAAAPGVQDAQEPKPAEKPKKRRFTDDDMTTARWMHDQVLKVNATARSPNFEVWADEVRLTREIDSRTHAEICDLFRWAKHDAFWCSNIQSPGKLREKWDQLVEKRARTGQSGSSQAGKFHLAGQDHTSSKNAMAASMARHGTVVPVDGEISFDD